MDYFDGVLAIEGTLLTPMAQVTMGGNLKTRTFVLEHEGITAFVEIPIFSGNGLGGLLRRAATYIFFRKALEKGYLHKIPIGKRNDDKESPLETNGLLSLYFLYSIGGGSVISLATKDDYSTYKAVKEITERNPFAGLFGVTLNIPSKLIVSDLVVCDIVNNMEHRQKVIELLKSLMSKKEETRTRISSGTLGYGDIEAIVVVDDITRGSVFAKLFISDKTMDEWSMFVKKKAEEKKVSQAQKNQKKENENGDRENKENKENQENEEKKSVLQHIQELPYIPAGTRLTGSISTKEPLTLIEYGLLLSSLKVLAEQSLTDTDNRKYRFAFGSFAKRGFGRVELRVSKHEDEQDVEIISVEKKSNVFDTPIAMFNPASELEIEAVEAFEEWLDNMDYETFILPLTFSQTYESKSKGKKGKGE